MSNYTSVYIRECRIERPVHQLCPLSQIRTDERPRNVYLCELFGPAGLAGLSGLALVIHPKEDDKEKKIEETCQSLYVCMEKDFCDNLQGKYFPSKAEACTKGCGDKFSGACCNDATFRFCNL